MGGRVQIKRVGSGCPYRVVTDVIVDVVAISPYRYATVWSTESGWVDVEMEVHLDSGTQQMLYRLYFACVN
jgi:hypothetical protein